MRGLFSLQRLRAGGALVLRRLGKFVGSQALDDIGAFLVDFQVVLAGFLARAAEIDKLLRGPDVAFLLVLAPEVAAVDEAMYFHGRLREAAIPLLAWGKVRVEPLISARKARRHRVSLIPMLSFASSTRR